MSENVTQPTFLNRIIGKHVHTSNYICAQLNRCCVLNRDAVRIKTDRSDIEPDFAKTNAKEVRMSDFERLSNEYLLLQERFDKIKIESTVSELDFLTALLELAKATQTLKELAADVASRYRPTNRSAKPHLRLVKKYNP
jgi:hypothetical protein